MLLPEKIQKYRKDFEYLTDVITITKLTEKVKKNLSDLIPNSSLFKPDQELEQLLLTYAIGDITFNKTNIEHGFNLNAVLTDIAFHKYTNSIIIYTQSGMLERSSINGFLNTLLKGAFTGLEPRYDLKEKHDTHIRDISKIISEHNYIESGRVHIDIRDGIHQLNEKMEIMIRLLDKQINLEQQLAGSKIMLRQLSHSKQGKKIRSKRKSVRR